MTRSLVVVLLLACVALPQAAAADDGPVTAAASVDRRAVFIGDRILLRLAVELPAGYAVVEPGVARALGDFEVLEALPAEQTTTANGGTRLVFRYAMSVYRLGDHVVPSISVTWADAEGKRGTATTELLDVRVQSVARTGEDLSQIRPLKPQLIVPGTYESLLAPIAAAAVAVALVVLAARWLLRRRRAAAVEPEPAPTPARRALRELRRIADLDFPAQGRQREHYELLAAALRAYLTERFGVAEGHTPAELFRDLETLDVDLHQATTIHDVLREAELTRFGDRQPYPGKAQHALRSALDILQRAVAAEDYATSPIRPL